jgi:oxygen-independent coproporphyrinogen-3 oxidase
MPWQTISTQVAKAMNKGLITQDANRLQPTLLGQRYLNNLLELFLK